MSRTGMPAEPLDVRRSLPKLCFFSLLWLPILSLGPVLVLASNGAVAPAEEEWIFGVQPLWWLAVALSAYAVWHFVLLWKALGAHYRPHEGVDGTAFSVWAPHAQAARVVALLRDEDLHDRITQNGRLRAQQEFSTERVIPQYERYYEEVIGWR